MIKRDILIKLQEHMASDQMTILIGPRQVGKTYLMSELQKQLQEEGKKTVWLNLDNEEDVRRFTSQASLLAFLELQTGREKAYVFIDEIQRKKNAGLFLKGIFDMNSQYKFVISGSGSLELKTKISESMAGRKQLFSIDPVSFVEFVNFKTGYQYENKLSDFFRIERDRTAHLFSEYMVFGGYPRVVLAETAEARQSQMQEIYRSYIDRDIHDLLHLEKTEAFNNILKILASQIGGMLNLTELSTTVGIDIKTVKRYLYYLEQTFIVQKVTPYFRNKRSEVTKAPIYYFIDIGLRNWLLGLFGLPEIPQPLSGHLFENVIFNMLRSKTALGPSHIHFWRTKDQAEVDFVLETGLEVTPIEVKYTKMLELEAPKSLRNFMTRYSPAKGYMIHSGDKEEDKLIGNTLVELLPYSKFIFQSLK